jgi:hypothetical protein
LILVDGDLFSGFVSTTGKECAVKTANIKDVVNIKGELFEGAYRKRKMRAENLYCWFNEKMVHYPHASIEISQQHEEWVDFHVTFSLTKEKGGWETGTETASYSVYVTIDRETDAIAVSRTTDASRWKLSGVNPGFKSFADSDRKALEFAKAFYSAAFLGI